MRIPKERKFYAVEGDDGQPRVMTAVPGTQADGAIEINEIQAMAISDSLRKGVERRVKPKGDYVTREEMNAQIRLAIKDVLSQLAEGANADV